jgi:hypothetical protein
MVKEDDAGAGAAMFLVMGRSSKLIDRDLGLLDDVA